MNAKLYISRGKDYSLSVIRSVSIETTQWENVLVNRPAASIKLKLRLGDLK
jgi:hypothetical protein